MQTLALNEMDLIDGGVDYADLACGLGVGLLAGGVAYFSGGTMVNAAVFAAPKVFAVCVYSLAT